MRLGAYPCHIKEGTLAHTLYNSVLIHERHRHRYEFNRHYKAQLEAAGLVFSGQCPTGALAEIVELKGHPFFIAGQFHPEFKSTPRHPHPLFSGLISAALKQSGRLHTEKSRLGNKLFVQ